MTTIRVTIDSAVLEQFAAKLAELGSDKARKVMADALNRQGRKATTATKRALVDQTGIAYRRIDTHIRPASAGWLTFETDVPGTESNVTDYRGHQVSAGVVARPWQKSHLFAHTFQIRQYGLRTFVRESSHRTPIREVYGPNAAREVIKDQSAATWERSAAQLSPSIEQPFGALRPEKEISMSDENEKPKFVGGPARSEVVTLTYPIEFRGAVYESITVHRLTVADIERHAQRYTEMAASDPASAEKIRLPVFGDVPDEVLAFADPDDMAAINAAVERVCIPKSLRTEIASPSGHGEQ